MVNIHHQLALLNQKSGDIDTGSGANPNPSPSPGGGMCGHINAGNGRSKAHLVMQVCIWGI